MNGHFIVVCSSCKKIEDSCECPPATSSRSMVLCTCGGCEGTNETIITPTAQQVALLQAKIDAIKNDIRASLSLPALGDVTNLLKQALNK